jgi:hypothetical protein
MLLAILAIDPGEIISIEWHFRFCQSGVLSKNAVRYKDSKGEECKFIHLFLLPANIGLVDI